MNEPEDESIHQEASERTPVEPPAPCPPLQPHELVDDCGH